MEKENYRDFAGDEKLAELQDKLNEAKIKSEHHKALEEQSKANLNLFEKITTDSAIKLAECQSHLTDLTQRLDEEKAELARQTDLMTQQEMINKAKAYTLQAAQKELEESQLRYCKTIETVNKIQNKIHQYEDSIEKAGIQVKSAYNNWQHNYNYLQKQKQAAAANSRTVEQLQAQIDNMSQQQEISKNQAADLLADAVIADFANNLDITDMNIRNLPKATIPGSSPIPEIPPIDDDLARLIKEATSETNSGYTSLRPVINEAEHHQEEANTVFALSNDETANEIAGNEETAEAFPKTAESEQSAAKKTEHDFWENKDAGTFAAAEVFSDMKVQKPEAAQAVNENMLEENADLEKESRPTVIPEMQSDSMPSFGKAANPQNRQENSGLLQQTTDEPIDEPTAKQEEKPKKKHTLLKYLLCILLAVILAFLLKNFVFQITEISGDSMEPTLKSGEITISSPLSYYFNDVQQFDIIVFKAPDRTDGAYYVKRIIGLPGDRVLIDNGEVAVNGTVLNEEYIDGARTEGDIDTLVPNGEYFVLGDNRTVSHDSRNPDVGTIPKDAILGKVSYQIYPFNGFGKIE